MVKLKLIKRILANTFIVFILMIMLRTHLSSSSPLVHLVYRPISYIQNFFSFYQNWSMFSPNPARINAYVDAEVEFETGEVTAYYFLRPSRNELTKRYLFGERFRKYFAEGIRMDKYSYLWPDTAKYIERDLLKKYPTKKIKEIRLNRHWYNIPDWKENFIPFTEKPNIPYKNYIFYTYKKDKNETK